MRYTREHLYVQDIIPYKKFQKLKKKKSNIKKICDHNPNSLLWFQLSVAIEIWEIG